MRFLLLFACLLYFGKTHKGLYRQTLSRLDGILKYLVVVVLPQMTYMLHIFHDNRIHFQRKMSLQFAFTFNLVLGNHFSSCLSEESCRLLLNQGLSGVVKVGLAKIFGAFLLVF